MATHSLIGFIVNKDVNLEVKEHNSNIPCKVGEYVSVYCHYDGYPTPDGVGGYLHENIKTYEDVIDLVLGGDISYINNSKKDVHYYSERGDSWENIKPSVDKDIPYDMEYVYKFENDTWHVSKNGRIFSKLSMYFED